VTDIVAARPRAMENRVERLVTWARISFALRRWELLLVGAGTVVLAGAMLWIAWQARLLVAVDPACFTGEAGGACQALADQFSDLAAFSRQVILASFAAPFGIGLMLGVPIVAHEIDHGTASLAWTQSRSRIRWLVRRVLFTLLVVIGLLALLGFASDLMAQAIMPGSNMAADFAWYGRRGGLLVMRGLLALGIGLTLGAMLGRQLPALLVAIVASIAIFTGVSLGMDRWLEADAVAAPFGQELSPGSLQLSQRLELPDGRVATWAELDPEGNRNIAIENDGMVYASIDENGVASDPIGRMVMFVVPGALYPTFVLRESVALGALALVVGGVGFFVVSRRRPY
jgi:ABC-type transport system involved in multi-copper enzyme maturation permease subunit